MCTPQSSEPAQVITDQTEENQEGTLCGFDKQAQCLSKHQHHGLWPFWLCPAGPSGPCYLSSLKSHSMSGQLRKNKRRADKNVVGIWTDWGKCQSPPEEKPAAFTQQVQTCGAPGSAACRLLLPRRASGE